MKPFDYYSKNQFPYPNKLDYITRFVYDRGECIHWASPPTISKSTLKETYPDAVIQEVFDNEAYKAQLKLYNGEESRLYEEFQQDLFEDYGVSDNPKRFKCFALAWERGHSCGYSEVHGVFGDLVELIKD